MEDRDTAERTSATQRVIGAILAGIESGTYPPGEQIPSGRELASQLNVGHNTVRDAVKSLVSRGVLVTAPGRGTFVAEGIGDGPQSPPEGSGETEGGAFYSLPEFDSLDYGRPIALAKLASSEKAAISGIKNNPGVLLAGVIMEAVGRQLSTLSTWVDVAYGPRPSVPVEIAWRNGPSVLDVTRLLVPLEYGGKIARGVPGLRLLQADAERATFHWLAYRDCYAELTRYADPGVGSATIEPVSLPSKPGEYRSPLKKDRSSRPAPETEREQQSDT